MVGPWKATRQLALTGASLAAMLLAAAPAFAQTPPIDAEADETAEEEDIVVTGTSIRGVAPVGSNLISVTRDDLVGQYIGHTAPKTKDVLKKAMGGVLFIDEAYYLYRPDNERDYGQEAIEILLQVMENQRDDLVVILAGYKDRMDTFFGSNPGMASRIAHHIDFPDYSEPELLQIARLMLPGIVGSSMAQVSLLLDTLIGDGFVVHSCDAGRCSFPEQGFTAAQWPWHYFSCPRQL